MMGERIWDAFLTAQDKASLAHRPPLLWGFGERPALVLVDMYRWVFGDRPQPLLEAIHEWPLHCGMAGWDALPHIQRILAAARAAKLPIVHVAGLEDDAGVEGWSSQGTLRSRERIPSAMELDHFRRRYDIIDEVAPLAGEAVLRKSAASAFWGTPLVAHLTANRIDTVVMCGETTSGCIRASAVDARMNRYNVIVPEEAVFDRHQAPHAINLFDIHQKYADVIPAADVLTHFAALTARAGIR
jgi:maleamate amidohydrolase